MEDGFDLFSTSYIPAKQVAAIDAEAEAKAAAELARKKFELGYFSLTEWWHTMRKTIFLEFYGTSPAYIIHDSIVVGWDFGKDLGTSYYWAELTPKPVFVKVPRYRPGTAPFIPFEPETTKAFILPQPPEPYWVQLNQRKTK